MAARRFLASFAVIVCLLFARGVSAAVLYVSPNGDDSHSGASWTLATKTIGQALLLAKSGDQVWVQQGTYVENITLRNGAGLYGGFAGTETQLVQRVWVANPTIIDGANTPTYTVYANASADLSTRLDGFTVRNGARGIFLDGSPIIANSMITGNATTGIQTYNCSPSITDCLITNNSGQGIVAGDGAVQLTRCTISNNHSVGIYATSCAMQIRQSMISNNDGGGAYGSVLTMMDCTIQNNHPTSPGGGVYGGGFRLTRCQITDNTATQGGGVYGSGSIIDCVVERNTATQQGGGIYVFGAFSISGSVVSSNTAGPDGGGIVCGGGVTIADCLITNNSSAGTGGGLSTYGSAIVRNVTITNNQAATGQGGGIWLAPNADNAISIVNSIIAFNSSGLVSDGSTQIIHNNCLSQNTEFDYKGYIPQAADHNVLSDPLFANPAAGDYHLTSASPCIDAGDDSFVTAGDLDLDGNPRIYGAHVDIGAYEYTVPGLASITLSPTTLSSGQLTTATVTLTTPALFGGATVTLVTTDSSLAPVPANIVVPAGATSATFTITAGAVTANKTATITAAFQGVTRKAVLTVKPWLATFTLSPTSVSGGSATSAKITLNTAAPAGGLTVNLSSSDPATVNPGASVVIPAGSLSFTFSINTAVVTVQKVVTLTASRGVESKSAALTVVPFTLKSLALTPTSVIGGYQTSTGVVTLSAAAPAGGQAVALSSSFASVAGVPASVTVAEGKVSASFLVTTKYVATSQTGTILATYATTKSAKLTVKPVAVASLSVVPGTVMGGENAIGIVTLTEPAAPGDIVVTIKTSNSAIAAPAVATITVPAGSSQCVFDIVTSGVAANTKVTITATGGAASKSGTLTVTP